MSFEKVGQVEIEGIQAHADLYKHKKHGCQFLNIKNDDPNNTLVIAFRTFPENDKGIAHVTEHMTLDGSKKYPVPGVFFELDKRSVNTFLNAFTFPDLTGYPLSSMNEVDFHNLMDVYLDSVFNPLFDPDTFMSECHHLEFTEDNNPNSPLSHGGVVYNEMKGVYSSADSYYEDFCNFNTLPKTIYANNYGGFPKDIETLTRDELAEFHDKFYHPSNCYIIHYGTFDEQKIMEHVDSYISKIEVSNIDTEKNLNFFPPKQTEPRRVVIKGPLDTSDDPEKQMRASITWIVGKRTDFDLVTDIKLLQSILVGSESTPIYDALIRSGLGSDFIHSHFTNEFRPLTFSIGVKGLKNGTLDQFEKTVFDTLEKIVKEGLDEEKISAGVHALTIKSKTIGRHHGIKMFEEVIHPWMDGASVTDVLQDHITSLQERCSKKGYLEGLIKRLLIDNVDRTLFCVEPSEEFNNEFTTQEKKQLEEKRAKMTEAEVKECIETANRLKEKSTGEKEFVDTLPSFSKENLSPLPIRANITSGNDVYKVSSGCNGIISIRVHGEIPVSPKINPTEFAVLADAVDSLGSVEVDDVKFSHMKQRYTSDAFSYVSARQDPNDENKASMIFHIGAKCLKENLPKAIEILNIMINANFSNSGKLKELIEKWSSNVVDEVIYSGSHYAGMYSSRSLNRKAALNELLDGITKKRFIRQLAASKDDISEKFKTMYSEALQSAKFTADIHATQHDLEYASPLVEEFVQKLNKSSKVAESDFSFIDEYMKKENASKKVFIHVDGQTNFIGLSSPIEYYTKNSAYSFVAAELLSQESVSPVLRENMGCYGACVGANLNSHTVSITSYRDGTPGESIKAAMNCLETSDEKVDQAGVDRAILSVSKIFDTPTSPYAKGQIELDTLVPYESRKMIRETAFSATIDDVKGALDKMRKSDWMYCIIGNKENLPEGFDVINF